MQRIVIPALLILFGFITINLSAEKYAVYFTDKNDTPYSIDNPGEFLSQRAIERRERHGIGITVQDIPVNPQYVATLKSMGANVPFTSKWLNCALVSCSQSIKNQIEQLSFVSQVIYISPGNYSGKSSEETIHSKFLNKLEKEEDFKSVKSQEINENYEYGQGYAQINQINGVPVHEQGFTGHGILIAVLDAGFQNVNTLSVFSNIYTENRMVFAMDVVNPNGNIYASNTSNHGTNVLSCMAAYTNNQFVGTAPKALYALIRTEDSATEYLVECYNWVVGAEAADSIGADIINTSLGYSTFDDASMNYSYSQMDGETPVASFAAKTAIEKGIFVTASAGNGNGSSWPWVASPGDATYAGTIGAVSSNGTIAGFSSKGPNGAGAPKPNVLARGVSATVYSTSGSVNTADGTSFSSPISCGMYACLIQANPNLHPALLRDIVDETGDRYPNHDIFYGYGIPNFAAALDIVLSLSIMEVIEVEIDDSQGNNNGKLNPGETVSLSIIVKNKSSETLNDVNAIIYTNNQDITFINNTAFLSIIAPDETTTLNNAFTLSLSENARPNSSIKFYITFTYDDKSVQSFFYLDTYGNLVEYQNYAVDDYSGNGNGVLEPGETANLYIYIINNGNEYAGGVSAALSSTSDIITINSNRFNIGNIIPEQTKYAKFNISVSDNAELGAISIPFQLQLTDNQGNTRFYDFTYSDKCGIIFELFDSWGDGWNGAAIIVNFDDGSPSQTLTFSSGYSATFTVNAEIGVKVSLVWQSGGWDQECSFIVKYQGGAIIYNGQSAPSAGVFHIFENYCGGTALPPNPPLHARQYAVHFKDKENTPYNIDEPLAYLSQRAIDRRNKFGIPITEADLPVDPYYVEKINMTGAYAGATSRWSNSVLVYAEGNMLELIQQFDFVEKIVYVKPAEGTYKQYDIHPKWINEDITITQETRNDYDYGYASGQIEQLNGVPVHKQGFVGEGVIIAVLDGGFSRANAVKGLEHLFASDRIVAERNIVDPKISIYDAGISGHGTAVLSCMGGYIYGEYVGTAPQASFALIVTEDSPTEYIIEEYFWMIGAEVADSLGADIINSSLGYTDFDDPTMDHAYSDMDGNTAISSIAAKMAVERGIFVCVSAGNSGNNTKPWIGSPADTPQVLSLGAVGLNGIIAGFSSIGPNGAGDPKPDVVACGVATTVLLADNTIGYASGTSFASPVTCGLVACIIGAMPAKTPGEIHNAVVKSTDRYPEHDIKYGYGIPDFNKVLNPIGVFSYENRKGAKLSYYPNPIEKILYISNPDNIIESVELYDVAGRLLKKVAAFSHCISVTVNDVGNGIIFVKAVYENRESETVKCVIIR